MNQSEALDRRCFMCKLVKPLDSFHRSNEFECGRANRCKDCANKRSRDYYAANVERVRQKNEKWRKENMERVSMLQAQRNLKIPEKRKARQAVRNALAAGTFSKSDCNACFATDTEFHHTQGYDKHNWFVGVWLCRPCHAKRHVVIREFKRKVKQLIQKERERL